MKRLLSLIVLAALAANIFQYCVKPPDYPIEPVITFQSVFPDRLFQQPFYAKSDTVYTDLTISFTDGDGDLGFTNDDPSLTITDTRLPLLPLNFLLPQVPEQGTSNGISGTILVRVPVSCCIPSPTSGGILLPACDTTNKDQLLDTVVYSIQVKDRAGNLSNTISSAPITLRCRRQ